MRRGRCVLASRDRAEGMAGIAQTFAESFDAMRLGILPICRTWRLALVNVSFTEGVELLVNGLFPFQTSNQTWR
jgi:hypothetical protein